MIVAAAFERLGGRYSFPASDRKDQFHAPKAVGRHGMIDDFIELDRTLHALAAGDTDQDDEAPHHRIGTGFNWPDLLTKFRVILLSEAGSGKTEEFRNLARALRRDGKDAFFMRLEFVADDFDSAFDVGTAHTFETWLASDQEGWLFLDSIDEARLRNPKDLERAVKRIGLKLSVAMARAHIFLSSRATAWRAKSDLLMCERTLPYDDSEDESSKASPRDGGPFRIVGLDDLTSQQIELFARRRSVPDPAALLAAIERADAWSFTSRPQDLDEVIGFWNSNGRIGSRLELMQASVARRLRERDPDRAEVRPISAAKIAAGAHLVAGAATLVRTQAIEVPDGGGGTSSAMATAPLLPDWTEPEISTLLSRPIFDAETYGAVRFHHRTVREYLTAVWLNDLLQRQTSRTRIEQLFFREQYGTEVVVPSMRPVLHWLVLFDDTIRRRVMRLAPDLFLEGGDPSQLPLAIRQAILRDVCARMARGGPRNLAYDFNAAQRFASADITPDVLDLIKVHADSEEVLWFLLRMIWQGQMAGALAVARQFALNPKAPLYVRVAAFRAVKEVGTAADMDGVRLSFANETGKHNRQWLAELVAGSPRTAAVADWIMRCIANAAANKAHTVDPLITAVIEFTRACDIPALVVILKRSEMLLAKAPVMDRRHCAISERYSWVLQPVAVAVERLIAVRDVQAMSAEALSVLHMIPRARNYDRMRDNETKLDIDRLIPTWPELKWALFWHTAAEERAWLDDTRKGDRLTDCWRVLCWSPNLEFGPSDMDSILSQIPLRSFLDDQMIVVSLAFRVYVGANRPRAVRERMKSAVKSYPELQQQLAGLLKPPPLTAEHRGYRRQSAQWQKRDQARKIRDENNRQEWRDALAKDFEGLRNPYVGKPEIATHGQHYLHEELRRLSGDRGHYSIGNWRLLAPEFGEDVARAFRDGVVAFARRQKPKLVSEGAPPNSIPFSAILGLTGLAIESAETPNWPSDLDDAAVDAAFRMAMHELNGFPPWLPRLYEHAPQLVVKLALAEVDFELARTDDKGSLHYLLHDLSYSGQWLWNDLGPPLLDRLSKTDDTGLENLRYLLNIIQGSSVPDADVAAVASQRVKATDPQRSATYFAMWVSVDPETAIPALETKLTSIRKKIARTEFAMVFISQLVGGRRAGGFWRRDGYKTADNIKRLFLLMHACIERKSDIERAGTGVYSPGLRDDAQDARDTLFAWLKEIPGKAAFVAIQEIANAHPDVDSRIWFEHHAKSKAELDSEGDPWRVDQVREFNATLERTPRNHRELFDLAVFRLLDLKADLEEGDNSEASVLCKEDQETSVRNYIANRLRHDAGGRYIATQEEELADAKRPDLRVQGMGFDGPVPMELKLADNWTGPALFERLETQLSGDYLRDVRSRLGLFVLVNRGVKKERWHPPGAPEPLGFADLVEALQAHWGTLAPRYPGVDEIRVLGIDLTKRGAGRLVATE